jgi:hypothetical protein
MITMYDDYIFSMLKHMTEHRPTLKPCQLTNRRTEGGLEHKEDDNDTNAVVIEIQNEAVLRNTVPNAATTIPPSKVTKLASEDETYLCHVPSLEDNLKNSHVIIEASLPNILGVDQSKLGGRYDEYLRRILYISPLLFATCQFDVETRERDTMSICNQPVQERALPLVMHLKEIFPDHFYVTDCVAKDLQTLLMKTRVLLSFHPTDEHDMLDEWAVLPALQCGTIVIAEHSALKELVPYQHMIIWVDVKDMVHTTEKVLAEYDVYHAQIFTAHNKKLLEQMRIDNYLRLERRLLSMNFSLDVLAKHHKKDTDSHNYIPSYVSFLEPLRFRVQSVLEIGDHASKLSQNMACWRDYFCYADVLGICNEPVQFENKTRVRSIIADVANSVDMDKIMNKMGDLDVVIDSSSDDNQEQRVATFSRVVKHIRPGGVYVLENVHANHDMFKDVSIFRDWILEDYVRTNFNVQVFDGRPQGSHGDNDFLIAFVCK